MNYLFKLLIIFIFYSGTVNLGNAYFTTFGRWLYISAALAVLFLCFYQFVHKSIELRYHKLNLLMFSTFLIANLITSIMNSEIELLTLSFTYFILYVAMSILLPSILKENTIETVNKYFIIIHIPIVLLPLYFEGLLVFPYHGGFYNENSMGIVGTLVLAVAISIILKNVESYIFNNRIKLFTIFLLGIFVILLLVIIASTASRTSFFTSLIIIVVGILMLFIAIRRELRSNGKLILKVLFRFIISLPPVVLLIAIVNRRFPIMYYIEESVLSKFNRQVEKGRLLSGRENIWKQTVKEAKLFGNGSDYFVENIGQTAHNTFIHILGVYGWVSLIIFVLIIISFMINSYMYFTKEKNINRYFPALLLIAFLGLSMAENLMHNITILLLFVYIGYARSSNKVFIKR